MGWIDKLRELKAQSSLSTREISKLSGIPEPTLEKLFAGQTKNPGINTVQQLVHSLGHTLDDLVDSRNTAKNATPLSDEAMKIARRYSALDSYGKATVCAVIDEEEIRIEEQLKLDNTIPEKEPKIINIFVNPSAAGPALGETGQACEPYELRPEDPQGAEYAVRIQGDSMEPDFPDGGIAFVNHDEMRDGDIGIFCVDGATVIKQWHYDRMMGMTYLFSLNRARADADVVLTRSNDRGMVWQGRVITRKHYPIPGKF